MNKNKRKMAKNKTAGVDGIPTKLWQKFDYMDEWLLVRVFNESKKMPEAMTTVVKLIFKKKERELMSNYRPISLLCTDYKLMAKIVTERMKGVLKAVIQNDNKVLSRMET